MKTVQEYYGAYRIMPSLQLHQLRVAAVAKQVCESFTAPIDTDTVVRAALLHDMGNILKFDLARFPEFLKPEGLLHWEGVKREYEEKYGSDQHAASLAIAREIGASAAVLRCIDAVAFSRARQTLESGSWEERVCEYADARVGPHGVLPLVERLEEARLRYAARPRQLGITAPRDAFDALVEAEKGLERLIFERCRIRPEDITDASVAPLVEELRNCPINW